jgi:hypothetical protein
MAVTITNEHPTLGTNAPAASAVADRVQVTVLTDGTATSVTITHNMAISATDLTAGFPEVQFEPLLTNNQLSLAMFVSGKAANLLGLTFLAVASNFRCILRRPHTIGR